MGKIITLALKDLRLLFRDKSGAFFVFFFPLIFAVFFGVIFSGGGGTGSIPIALVDEDSTRQSIDFARKLTDAEGLEVIQTDRQEAELLVKRGKKAAYIILKNGFGEAVKNPFLGENNVIEIGVDPSRKAEAAMLEGMLTGLYMESMVKTFTDPSLMRERIAEWRRNFLDLPDSSRAELAYLNRFFDRLDSAMAELEKNETADTVAADEGQTWQPVTFDLHEVTVQREGPKNSFEVTFPQAIVWAMIGCAAAFGIGLVVERTRGTLVRLRMAPLTLSHILGGKGLACLSAIMIVGVMLMLVFSTVLGVRPASYAFLLLALLSSGVCFVGIMMMLSVLGKTEASAGGVGWAVLLVMAMLGGGMIPLFFMPSWMRAVSSVSPVKWVVLTLEGAVWRGFSPILMFEYCALLVGIGAVFFIIGSRIFRMTVE